ncbi:MAG: nucleotidyltransferase domain-containing protein [Saprospiraceae bacterium]|nr:nucleotidyltransferase domain-containing protein [Saprospiraceae bacterium]
MKISAKDSFQFKNGLTVKNRFMLAPMTNCQSFENGELSDDELNWLVKRAEGQFGIVMTCASHVQEIGKGFPGQLGIFSDNQISGHQRLTQQIKSIGSTVLIQLHHAGMRSPAELIGTSPVCPSTIEKYGTRALTLEEVRTLRDDFINAAIRAQKAGYDGVEVHGAHGYIITQFLSSKVNTREDEYGGSLENRQRLLIEIVEGIRESCGANFVLGVRLSPERFGMKVEEMKSLCQRLVDEGNIDFLDVSLWDCFKMPEEEDQQHQTLLEHFSQIDYKNVVWTVAGKIRSARDVQSILDAGVDFVSIGRSAILHHDFPNKVMNNSEFEPIKTPVTETYLSKEGLGDKFIEYMKRWPDFVKNRHSKINQITHIMTEKIQNYLDRLEEEKDIKILWACETGSRAWGFASTDSDFDVRIIYVHKMNWYLHLADKKDSIEVMYENNDIDITGWDLRKSLHLLIKSNASMLERIQSDIVYRSEDGFIESLKDLAVSSYSKIATMHHYLSMSKKFYNDIKDETQFKLKKFFYLLRSALVCKWIIEKEVMPPIDFHQVYKKLNLSQEVVDRIDALIALKSTIAESYFHSGENQLMELIHSIIEEADSKKLSLPSSSGNIDELSSFFIQTVRKYDH